MHFEVIKAFFMNVCWQLLLAQLLQVWVRLVQSFELFHWQAPSEAHVVLCLWENWVAYFVFFLQVWCCVFDVLVDFFIGPSVGLSCRWESRYNSLARIELANCNWVLHVLALKLVPPLLSNSTVISSHHFRVWFFINDNGFWTNAILNVNQILEWVASVSLLREIPCCNLIEIDYWWIPTALQVCVWDRIGTIVNWKSTLWGMNETCSGLSNHSVSSLLLSHHVLVLLLWILCDRMALTWNWGWSTSGLWWRWVALKIFNLARLKFLRWYDDFCIQVGAWLVFELDLSGLLPVSAWAFIRHSTILRQVWIMKLSFLW